jgi:carboxymethylenebutenolidase
MLIHVFLNLALAAAPGSGAEAGLLLGQESPPTPAERPSAPPAEGLPPDADGAKAALEQSSRHGEWVDVKARDGAVLRTWVVYPERKDKAPVVIVIHEIFGLTDWVRAVADHLAADGFIAVAPDLLSGKGPNGGGTEAFADRDSVTKAVSELRPEEVVARLNAVRDHALAFPSASGTSASIGFCWGGTTSFAYAGAQPDLNAAVVYYGTASHDPKALKRINAPVLGLYGGDDARVTSTVEQTRKLMQELGKTYEPHVFEGAGHGFLRNQSGQEGANLRAARAAWPLTVAFLRQHTK